MQEIESGSTMSYQKGGDERELHLSSLHPYYTYRCFVSAYTVDVGPAATTEIITHEEGETAEIANN